MVPFWSIDNAGSADLIPPATAGVENPTPADATNVRTHVVAKGETLSQISKQYGVTVEEMERRRLESFDLSEMHTEAPRHDRRDPVQGRSKIVGVVGHAST